MKPTQKTCEGCPHFTRNLHFISGYTRLFCNLAAQYLRDITNCPRQRLHLIQEANQIQEAR
ncbi:hypothetical protein ES707_10075 [subsurface metagenome]